MIEKTDARFRPVSQETDFKRRMQIERALSERDARAARHIVEMLISAADLIDTRPPNVLQAIVDHIRDLQKPDSDAPQHREHIREELRLYCIEALKRARRTEDDLLQGITSMAEPPPKSQSRAPAETSRGSR